MKRQNFLVASLSLFFEARYPLASALTHLKDRKLITLARDDDATHMVPYHPLRCESFGGFLRFMAWIGS